MNKSVGEASISWFRSIRREDEKNCTAKDGKLIWRQHSSQGSNQTCSD